MKWVLAAALLVTLSYPQQAFAGSLGRTADVSGNVVYAFVGGNEPDNLIASRSTRRTDPRCCSRPVASVFVPGPETPGPDETREHGPDRRRLPLRQAMRKHGRRRPSLTSERRQKPSGRHRPAAARSRTRSECAGLGGDAS
jgi:hypothetical protein